MNKQQAEGDWLVLGMFFFSLGVAGVCRNFGMGCLVFGGLMLAVFFLYYLKERK